MFDGSPEIYEEYFQSGKLKFREFVKEIARELRNCVYGKKLEEKDKSLLEGPMASVKPPKKPEIIAVDLDNTLIDKDNNLINGAKEALEKLKEKGYEIVVYTARFALTPKDQWQSLHANIEGLLNKLQVPFDKISLIKPVCKFYIDDRGVKFDNWSDVMKLIEPDLTEEGPQDLKPANVNGPSPIQRSKAGIGTGNIGIREGVDELNDDMYSLYKSFSKKFPAMSSDAKRIKAAKELAKKYKLKYQEILKNYTPSNNLEGDQSWDKEGNIVESKVFIETQADDKSKSFEILK